MKGSSAESQGPVVADQDAAVHLSSSGVKI